MACDQLADQVWNRPGLDLLTRAILVEMLRTTTPGVLLYWRSEVFLAERFGVGERTVRRVFDRLRRAGVLVRAEWPTAFAGERRSRCECYSIDPSCIDLIESPQAHREAARNRPQEPAQESPGTGPTGRIEPAPRAYDSRETPLEEDREGEGRARAATAPPDPVKRSEGARPSATASPRDRLRTLCARLGYSTRPDAVDELAEWLVGQGFRSVSTVTAFLASAAKAILPTCSEARSKGLYLRHVRPHCEVWRYEDAEAVA